MLDPLSALGLANTAWPQSVDATAWPKTSDGFSQFGRLQNMVQVSEGPPEVEARAPLGAGKAISSLPVHSRSILAPLEQLAQIMAEVLRRSLETTLG